MAKQESDQPGLIALDEWQQQVVCFFKAMLPGLFIQTSEETRAMSELIEVVQWLAQKKLGQREFQVWSDVSYRKYNLFGTPSENTGSEPEYVSLEQTDFASCVNNFGKFDDAESKKHKPATLVLCDSSSALQNPVAVRALREALNAIKGTRKTICLMGLPFSLPKEIANDLSVIPFELPDYKELYTVILPILEDYKKLYPKQVIQVEMAGSFCRACSGISQQEALGLIQLALAKYAAFDARAVTLALKEKERIVKRSDVLECITPTKNLESVGGLENVKAWVQSNTMILRSPDQARAYGLKLPAGLLLTGIPGTGKSLTAKALAAEWQVPLLICDIGNIFASHVGESESRFREVTKTCHAARPCVLLIDEIEKGLGNSGDGDSGVTNRIKGAFLTFLQEKSDEIFVVATANDLRKLESMPELCRRFSKIFSCDLPGKEDRCEILKIHLEASGHPMSTPEVLGAALKSAKYSGAELESVVQAALRVSFAANLMHPTSEILENAVKTITPIAVTMKEQIDYLREWGKSGRAQPASNQSLEQDELEGQDYTHGKVDLN